MNITILAAADLGEMIKETGETFGFDLKIFLSQVISFVIVALVLRQFAYKPILKVLEERRQRIAEGLLNAEKIKQQLAEAEQRHAEILSQANAQAQKMIDEARESAAHVAERKQQEAVVAAEQIMAKAREASAIEHEKTMADLKRELGRLVVDTPARLLQKRR
jgi:F-type H+-transporting ATPase subunit b